MTEGARYVRVVPEDSYERAYDYALPGHLAQGLRLGSKVRIPLRRTETTGYVIDFPAQPEVSKIRAILGVSQEHSFIPASLFRVASWMSDYYCAPLAACLRCVLPEPVRHEAAAQVRQWIEPRGQLNEAEADLLLGRAKKQREAYHHLLGCGGSWLAELERSKGLGRAVWLALVDKGLASISTQAKERDPLAELGLRPSSDSPILMLEQEQVLAQWRTERKAAKPRPFLLHGVTGSGKTEVYLRAMAEVLSEGKTALMVVPEIVLTPQAIERLRDRFLGQRIRVAVLHSHLSRGEKRDQWQQARDGRARVVIGARSAVFAPLANLGLIVVDEEHEHTYKQEETPHYHGRDVAVLRAHLEGASIMLGSATPSLESWANAVQGKYLLAQLTKRVSDRRMPTVHVVDQRQKKRAGAGTVPCSLTPPLREAMEQRLARGEQTILYLNRRGHSTSLQCPDCGHVEMCPRCSVTLTYHRTSQQLRCHLCDHAAPVPQTCPECRSQDYRYAGLGTQKLEESIIHELGAARVLRMDSDSMRGKHAYREALAQVARGEVDVLLGTQMIAKGLDFPMVTCVGVINVDGALQMPDYRASERVFQQLMQVAGRAGRGERGGEVFVQTHTPFHPAIQFARHHDYAGFVEQELEFRKALGYPPYRRALMLLWRGRNEEKTCYVAAQVMKSIREAVAPLGELGELAPAPIARIDYYYRYHALLLTTRVLECARRLRSFVWDQEYPEGVRLTMDVDPLSVL
jgi:primosomal protein N' (replication factor Y) (superfamily II helicase)